MEGKGSAAGRSWKMRPGIPLLHQKTEVMRNEKIKREHDAPRDGVEAVQFL